MIIGTYYAREFNLSGLNGISDRTLESHFKLYEGYVKGTNDLNQRIADTLRRFSPISIGEQWKGASS